MTQHQPIEIVVGLGNPGDRYEQTRHNAGFWFVDRLAREYGGIFREDRRHQGEIARVTIRGVDLLLLKPNTFMNRSGASVRSLAAYLKVAPECVLVAHDELDLPVGTVRLKRGGGPGGHNGLKDVIAHLGREFYRLRIGIGHPREQGDVIDYVLKRPRAEQQARITDAIELAADVLPVMLAEGDQRAMNKLHSPPPPAPGDNGSDGEG
ncbi:MAG: aminoacyl-tRNA hydrolase [Gammaproteobacteria bacterium]